MRSLFQVTRTLGEGESLARIVVAQAQHLQQLISHMTSPSGGGSRRLRDRTKTVNIKPMYHWLEEKKGECVEEESRCSVASSHLGNKEKSEHVEPKAKRPRTQEGFQKKVRHLNFLQTKIRKVAPQVLDKASAGPIFEASGLTFKAVEASSPPSRPSSCPSSPSARPRASSSRLWRNPPRPQGLPPAPVTHLSSLQALGKERLALPPSTPPSPSPFPPCRAKTVKKKRWCQDNLTKWWCRYSPDSLSI